MSKAVADLFWNEHYSDYALAVGIGAALPVLRAALDAVVFKVSSRLPLPSARWTRPGASIALGQHAWPSNEDGSCTRCSGVCSVISR